jgi:hypothetical protein
MNQLQDGAPEHSGAEKQIARTDESDICRADSLIGRIVKTLRRVCNDRLQPIEGNLSLNSSMHRLRAIEQFRQAILKRAPRKEQI